MKWAEQWLGKTFWFVCAFLLVCEGAICASPIEKKLEEIVALRKRELDLQQKLYSEQRISDVSGARIALARARIDLAKEKGDAEAVIEQLEVIVAVRKLDFETAKIREEIGSGSAVEARVALLRAEIELERGKKVKREKKE